MMQVIYTILEGEQEVDEHQLCHVCGIKAQMGREFSQIKDVSPDKSEVIRIARLLEREQVHPIHLYDVISDLVGRSAEIPV